MGEDQQSKQSMFFGTMRCYLFGDTKFTCKVLSKVSLQSKPRKNSEGHKDKKKVYYIDCLDYYIYIYQLQLLGFIGFSGYFTVKYVKYQALLGVKLKIDCLDFIDCCNDFNDLAVYVKLNYTMLSITS